MSKDQRYEVTVTLQVVADNEHFAKEILTLAVERLEKYVDSVGMGQVGVLKVGPPTLRKVA